MLTLLSHSSTFGVRPDLGVLGGVLARVLELVREFSPREAAGVLRALSDWKVQTLSRIP